MEHTTIAVRGMSCSHCVMTVERGLGQLPGVKRVAVDLEAQTVTISHEGAAPGDDKLRAAIDDMGYEYGRRL
ncbi:MAG: heavy-metal-associated domain-containing protein [Deltaproteobacteria bacterium]|nr:heavy-metal-associated domain-containing protein [Deltaproteobacteria bacterium]